VNGAAFYDITSNDTNLLEPPLQTMSPTLPMPMKAGTTIDWQCNYTGNGMFDRPFGDSYVQNVTYFYMGLYYPADTTSATIRTSSASTEGARRLERGHAARRHIP
jgi:hypothetical protein